MKREDLKPGDRIRWGYNHCIGRYYHWVIKCGVFVGIVKHTPKYKVGNFLRPQLAIVKFDGNKGISRIPIKDLAPILTKETP